LGLLPLTRFSRYDRYRNSLKGSWKDTASPGTGLVYDLGTHLIDQALHLFGKPSKITAFLQNLRGIGDDSVDDNVIKPCLPCSARGNILYILVYDHHALPPHRGESVSSYCHTPRPSTIATDPSATIHGPRLQRDFCKIWLGRTGTTDEGPRRCSIR
jgi:predicted dehydrogenase